uniref:Uncharacterized protein n=1 Tax=Anguilla anguilla TaxID=7936 RepID=A0A0E9SGH2_ANGAN
MYLKMITKCLSAAAEHSNGKQPAKITSKQVSAVQPFLQKTLNSHANIVTL